MDNNRSEGINERKEIIGRGYFVLIILGCFNFIIAYTHRVNLSLVMVEIVQTFGEQSDKKYLVVWTSLQRGIVQASFYFGYFLMQFTGGMMAQKYGGKVLITISLVSSSVLTLLSPLAILHSPWLLSLLRITMGCLQGFLITSTQILSVNWVPDKRLSTAISLIFTGTQWGSILGFLCTAALAKLPNSWRYSFYLFGGFGLLMSLIWHFWMTDLPRHNKYISKKERDYLIRNCKQYRKIRLSDIPLKSMLSSKHCIVLYSCEFTSMWITFSTLTIYPKYLFAKFGFTAENQMVASTIPYLSNMAAMSAAGIISDYMISGKRISRINVRKICLFLGIFPCCFIFLATTFLNKNQGNVTVLMFALGNLFNGFQITIIHNAVDLSPQFCATVMGIASSFGTLGGTIAPLVNEIITKNQYDVTNWQIVFGIAAGYGTLSSIAYIIWGSSKRQSWDLAFTSKKSTEL